MLQVKATDQATEGCKLQKTNIANERPLDCRLECTWHLEELLQQFNFGARLRQPGSLVLVGRYTVASIKMACNLTDLGDTSSRSSKVSKSKVTAYGIPSSSFREYLD